MSNDPEILKKQLALKANEISELKDEIIEISRELVRIMKSLINKDQLLRTMERRVEALKKSII